MVGVVSAPRASSHLALEVSPGQENKMGVVVMSLTLAPKDGERENMAGMLTGSGLRFSRGTADLGGEPYSYSFMGMLLLWC